MIPRFAATVTAITGVRSSSRPAYITGMSKQSIKLLMNFDPSQSSHDVGVIEGLLEMLRGQCEEHPTRASWECSVTAPVMSYTLLLGTVF